MCFLRLGFHEVALGWRSNPYSFLEEQIELMKGRDYKKKRRLHLKIHGVDSGPLELQCSEHVEVRWSLHFGIS